MGPVEIVFLVVIAIFGVIGIVRGYQRELGVTTLLVAALAGVTLLEQFVGPRLNQAYGAIGGAGNEATTQAVLVTLFLFLIVFIAYQGETLVYPGGGSNGLISFLVGLVNGYLFAGTIWYYWNKAGWPGGLVHPPFTAAYDAMVKLLPPAILPWWFFVGLLILMLILRVIR